MRLFAPRSGSSLAPQNTSGGKKVRIGMASNKARHLRNRRADLKTALRGGVCALALLTGFGTAAPAQEQAVPEDPTQGTTVISGSGTYYLPNGVYVPPVLRPQAPEAVRQEAAPLPEAPPAPAAPQEPAAPDSATAAEATGVAAGTAATQTEAPEPRPEAQAAPQPEPQAAPEEPRLDETPVPVEPEPEPAPETAPEPEPAPAPAPEPEPEPEPEPQAEPASEPQPESAAPPAVPVAPVDDVTGQPLPEAPAEVEEAEEGEEPAPQRPAGDIFTVAFEPATSRLPEGSDPTISQAADLLLSRPGKQVILLAYAAGEDDTDARARRLSLARALAVRGKLIEFGVLSTRVEIRPLGAAVIGGGDPDRVELIVQP